MAVLTLRELDGHRASFRTMLSTRKPHMILVTDQQGRCLEVDISPNGVDAWTLRITSAGVVIIDSGGSGIGLNDEGFAEIIVAAFGALDPHLSPN